MSRRFREAGGEREALVSSAPPYLTPTTHTPLTSTGLVGARLALRGEKMAASLIGIIGFFPPN